MGRVVGVSLRRPTSRGKSDKWCPLRKPICKCGAVPHPREADWFVRVIGTDGSRLGGGGLSANETDVNTDTVANQHPSIQYSGALGGRQLGVLGKEPPTTKLFPLCPRPSSTSIVKKCSFPDHISPRHVVRNYPAFDVGLPKVPVLDQERTTGAPGLAACLRWRLVGFAAGHRDRGEKEIRHRCCRVNPSMASRTRVAPLPDAPLPRHAHHTHHLPPLTLRP